MYRQIIIILSFFNFGLLAGQSFFGDYKYHEEIISFKKDTLAFDIYSNGGLTIEFKGEGQYILVGEYLVVRTSVYKGLRSNYEKTCDGKFEIKVRPDEMDGKGHQVIYRQYDGSYKQKPSTETKSIEIYFVEGDPLIIPFSNCHFDVSLYSGQIIENKTTVFKIHSFETNSVTLELLTTDFHSKTITLKKLRKKEKIWKRKYGHDNYIKKFVQT